MALLGANPPAGSTKHDSHGEPELDNKPKPDLNLPLALTLTLPSAHTQS